jgi:hypothetical protein
MTTWQRLGGASIINLEAWIIMTLWMAILPVSYFAVIFHGNPLGLIAASLAANTVSGGILLVARFTVLRTSVIQAQPLLTLATFLLAGCAVSLIVRFGNLELRVSGASNFGPLQMLLPVLSYTSLYVVVSLLTDAGIRFRRSLAELLKRIEQTQIFEVQASQELAKFQARVVTQIQDVLDTSFTSIALRGGDETTADQLHQLVDDVVRPLSHELAVRTELDLLSHAGETVFAPLPRRQRVVAALRNVAFTHPFSPLVASLLFAISEFGSKVRSTDLPTGLLMSLASFIFVFLFLRVAVAFQNRWQESLSRTAWVISVCVIFVATAAVDAAISLSFAGLTSGHLSFFLYIILANLFCLVLIAAVRGIHHERDLTLMKLSTLATDLQWKTSRMHLLAWSEKRRLATLLHGDIQGRISAVAFQFQLRSRQTGRHLQRGDQATTAIIRELRTECEAALFRPRETHDLWEFFASMTSIWRASVVIHFDLSPELGKLIAEDPSCSDATVEIVREGITNAMKHGNASAINVALDANGTDSLAIHVTDNGRRQEPLAFGVTEERHGMGNQLLDELTTSWTRVRRGQETILVATVALASHSTATISSV